MATRKQQKTELIAIYRLEFYKKQKNWKLSTDTKKEKESQNSCPTAPIKNINILNETYNIETNVDDNVDNNCSVLNDAFLGEESDKDAQVTPTTQPNLCTQWLAPINACQECQHNTKPENPWADYVSDGLLGHDDRCSGDGNEVEGFEGWSEGMVWTNSGIPQSEWPGDVPALLNVQGVQYPEQAWAGDTVLYQQLDQLGHMTPWPDDQGWGDDQGLVPHWGEDELLMASLESVDEFMIGAHSAPHSSEVDLCVPTGAEALNASSGALSRLSGAQLSAAVCRHTGSLRRLLREAGTRRKHRSTLSLDLCAPDHFGLAPRDFFSTEYSFEAFPTREIPTAPPSPIYLCKDTFPPVSSINQCKDAFYPMPPINQNIGAFTPTSAVNQYKDIYTPVSPANYTKNTFVPLSSASKCKEFSPVSPMVQNKDNFINNPVNECRDAFNPPSPANLYRDGFLAGSYRNRVGLEFVGRGRGRLQGDGGSQA